MAAHDISTTDWKSIVDLVKLAKQQFDGLQSASQDDKRRSSQLFDSDEEAKKGCHYSAWLNGVKDDKAGELFECKAGSLVIQFEPVWRRAVWRAASGANDFLKSRISALNELHSQMMRHFADIFEDDRIPDYGLWLEKLNELETDAKEFGYGEKPNPTVKEKVVSKPKQKKKRQKSGSKELTDAQEKIAGAIRVWHGYEPPPGLSVTKMEAISYRKLCEKSGVKSMDTVSKFFDKWLGNDGNKKYKKLCKSKDPKQLAFEIARLSPLDFPSQTPPLPDDYDKDDKDDDKDDET